MIERTYKCNLCLGHRKPDAMIAVNFSTSTSDPFCLIFPKTPAASAENHLCKGCIRDILAWSMQSPGIVNKGEVTL
jgi:hypothetical protein